MFNFLFLQNFRSSSDFSKCGAFIGEFQMFFLREKLSPSWNFS